MKIKIPYGKQFISEDDVSFVAKSLKKEFLSSGPEVVNFESNIKKYCKSKYALVCNSGTSALHLAFMAIGLKKNDVVIMPAINFIASYSMCSFMGAKIYLSDVDHKGQISSRSILECIKKNKIKKIKCVVSMHLGGSSDNICDINNLKKKYKFNLVEDACHAFGSKYKYKNSIFNTGSCAHSDITIFSFHPIKTITTGEGGAITTNSKSLYSKLKAYRSHGIIRSVKHWNYDIKHIGYNFRLSDINCALGSTQLKKINKFLIKRKKIAKFYYKKLKNFNDYFEFNETYNRYSAYHLFIIRMKFKNFKNKKKDDFLVYMKKNSIYLQFHYIPIYQFTFFQNKKYTKPKVVVNSEKYYKEAISLPIYYDIKLSDMNKVIEVIKKFIKEYKKDV